MIKKFKPGKNRLVLIVLKKEDCAAELHNFGRGRKLDNGIWINPDLTRTERDAKYLEREIRREKKKNSAARHLSEKLTAFLFILRLKGRGVHQQILSERGDLLPGLGVHQTRAESAIKPPREL